MRVRTVYISGKITDDPLAQKKFKRAAQIVSTCGYVPVLPYFEHQDDFDYRAHMDIDLAILGECDGICLLPDWQDSRGAKQEYSQALALNKAQVSINWERYELDAYKIEI